MLKGDWVIVIANSFGCALVVTLLAFKFRDMRVKRFSMIMATGTISIAARKSLEAFPDTRHGRLRSMGTGATPNRSHR